MSKKQNEPLNNYTVEQILSMGDDELNKTNQRQMSHMLRTVALAANKRITRLENNEKKGGIATDALNTVQDSGGRFYVGGKTRNQMLAELARAREFMNMKTSTVKGATEVRKNRERMLYGATREEIEKERKKKKKKHEQEERKRKRDFERQERKKEKEARKKGKTYTPREYVPKEQEQETPVDYDEQLKEVFKAYRKFNEQNPNEGRKDYFDSGKALAYIGRIKHDEPEITVDELQKRVNDYFHTNAYEEYQKELQKQIENGNGTTFSNH